MENFRWESVLTFEIVRFLSQKNISRSVSVAPPEPGSVPLGSRGLRRGLYSVAASRLGQADSQPVSPRGSYDTTSGETTHDRRVVLP